MNPQTRAEKLYQVADEQLEVVSHNEMLSWKDHPCTRSLLLNLEADLEILKDEWAQGNFTHETAEATLQMNSNNIGMAQAIEKVTDWIRNIVAGEQE